MLIGTLILGTGVMHAQKLVTKQDSLSYALGVVIAENLKHQGLDEVNTDLFAAAVKAVSEGKEQQITSENAQDYILRYQQEKQESSNMEAKAVGEKFLRENAKRPEVKTTDSGLQYEVLQEGTGDKPTAEDEVVVHYHGTLIDGTVFDSSYDRGEPAQFQLNRVIKGWTEVLQLMPEGSKWRVYIPENLAYGSRGAGAVIEPFSTLIFDIELLEVK